MCVPELSDSQRKVLSDWRRAERMREREETSSINGAQPSIQATDNPTFLSFLQNYRQQNGSPLSSASIRKYGVEGPLWLEKHIPAENLVALAASGKKSRPVQQHYDTFYITHNKTEGNYMWHRSFKLLCDYEKSRAP